MVTIGIKKIPLVSDDVCRADTIAERNMLPMRIVSQSAPVSYSHFPAAQLLLPAHKIAGLLAAPKSQPPPPPAPFVYHSPRLADLSEKNRTNLDKLVTTLLDAAVGLLADEFSESEFALAHRTFLRQV